MKSPAFFFLAFVWFSHTATAQDNKRSPVIVIMADQLRFDVPGEWTPNIAELRRDGVSFNRAYCASPICVPSRGSFFTGRYPNRTGSLINGWEEEDRSYSLVKSGIANLYSVFETKWDSWHVGKQHFLTEDAVDKNQESRTRWITQEDYTKWTKEKGVAKPGGKNFKAMVPELISGEKTHRRSYSIPAVARYEEGIANFPDHYFVNEIIAAIKNRDPKKPLLMNAMLLAPHPPFHIPEPYFSMFDDVNISIPENVGEWYQGQSPLQLYNLTGFLGSRYSREEWSHVWKKYAGLVRLLDDEVGRIIRALKEEGLYDRSTIIFTADHGEMLGSHGLWQKMCMYEESARVPLIIKFPRGLNAKGKEAHVPVSLIDVFPTLLELHNMDIPNDLDGSSLLPLVTGKEGKRNPVFIQYDGNGSLGNFQRCIVKDDYKLILDIFNDEVFLEVYNLKSDPYEKVNLAFDDANRARSIEMLDMLQSHMLETGDRLTLPANVYNRFLSDYQNIISK